MGEDVNSESGMRAPPSRTQTERNNDWVDLFNQGCTFEDIARLRNTTREAVAGAIWRSPGRSGGREEGASPSADSRYRRAQY